MVSPILYSETMNIFNEDILWFIFQLANWKTKTTYFGPIRNFVSFSTTYSTWKKFVEKNSETNWWTHLMNSLDTTSSMFGSIVHYVSSSVLLQQALHLSQNARLPVALRQVGQARLLGPKTWPGGPWRFCHTNYTAVYAPSTTLE